MALDFALPVVRRWFEAEFGDPTEAQVRAWPAIARGDNVLLLAPTGSGKTLAAFLVAIDRVLREPQREAGTRVLYVSPLKALGVDIERNLRRPLDGVRQLAETMGVVLAPLQVGVRSGDTPAKVRAQLVRKPPELLITTPESLYLMLTSRARTTLSHVETVIIDEIHAFGGSKRGSHLFLSLERLEAVRATAVPLQRIGLSATQRPIEEAARLLGGYRATDQGLEARAVTVIDAPVQRRLELRVELPVEDLSTLASDGESPGGATAASIWPELHPRLLELINGHRSTMVFVNSRRLAERLANAINELAGEELVLAHHGSIAKEQRASIEARLKSGELRAIVATSSLELGIDMGAVDLVIQVEAPASIASGVQRVGRAGHQVGGVSRGVFFPKFQGDLLATAAVVERIGKLFVEATRFPKNPLDVLAQQIVAEVVINPMTSRELYDLVRGAAPFRDLPRSVFDGVLDMLSGRYPSERFRELRARLIWDRNSDQLRARRGARLLAISNGGTITDRGLYGVFLSGTEPAVRVGELDEEMVFESRVGEVFLLGASSWRIDDIAHDRVWVTPAPGEPGKMPFWRGERPGRSFELGCAIGQLTREVEQGEDEETTRRLQTELPLDQRSAQNLVRYVHNQATSGRVPTDLRIVVECFVDEVGDWRVLVLSPFGGAVHQPWVIAVTARLRRELGLHVDSMWLDDGLVFRLPGTEHAPRLEWFVPEPEVAREDIEHELFGTSVFAVNFRQNASRALLLPRRSFSRRTPLWVQARRARDLLSVARDFGDFPVVLETYRECLSDIFDMESLSTILGQISEGSIDAELLITRKASPFASTLLFSYVANFIYDNDAPVAEQRAQALSLDHEQLRLLLGEPELRELLDPKVIADVARSLQRLDGARPVTGEEDVYDLLWELGALSMAELSARVSAADGEVSRLDEWLMTLTTQGRIVALSLLGQPRYVVVEDAARYRDGLGAELPTTLPSALLTSVVAPLQDLVLRYARTHGPFELIELKRHFFGAAEPESKLHPLRALLEQLTQGGLLVHGAFLPQRSEEEWCHRDVLARIKRASLSKARREIAPVSAQRYAQFLSDWQHLNQPLEGLDGVLTIVEQLQGLALPFEDLEKEILPLRVSGYRGRDLDELCALGEVVWCAQGSELEPKVRLFLAEQVAGLWRQEQAGGELPARIRQLLAARGALFFGDIKAAIGGFETEVFNALWQLVWASEVTNDTLAPLRSRLFDKQKRTRPSARVGYRSRRAARPGTEGRWALVAPVASTASVTERIGNEVMTLLLRYGLVTRETMRTESGSGGFTAIYPMLKALEERGRVRRGYFVEGLGGAQFAFRGAESRLRSVEERDETLVLCAADPANPYGATLPWPRVEARFARAAGCHVVLRAGRLLAYSGKHQRVWTLLCRPANIDEPGFQPDDATQLLKAVQAWFEQSGDRAWIVETINGESAAESPWAVDFSAAGFAVTSKTLLKRRGDG